MNEYTKYISVKSTIEGLFGSDAWYALKETNNIPTWRRYAQKVLRAVRLAITDTVEICDREWLEQVRARLDRGIEEIGREKAIDEIIGVLAATMIEVSFLQIGVLPHCSDKISTPLRQGAWKLNGHRSVVYLQTKEQKEAQFRFKQRKQIGFEVQLDLQAKFHQAKSKLSYSEWCAQQVDGEGESGT